MGSDCYGLFGCNVACVLYFPFLTSQTGDVMLIYGGFDEGVKAYTGMWRFNFGIVLFQFHAVDNERVSNHTHNTSYKYVAELA